MESIKVKGGSKFYFNIGKLSSGNHSFKITLASNNLIESNTGNNSVERAFTIK